MRNEFSESLGALDLEERVQIPYVIKNATLISPGNWNNFYYTSNVIHRAFKETDWTDKKILSLFLDHRDNDTSEWVGYVRNARMIGDILKGDLYIYDINTAVKLALGKPKFGISPRVKGKADEGIMRRYIYENFSFVINPAVRTTYINNMEVKGMDFKKLQEEGEKGEAKASEPTEEKTTKEEETKKTEETKENKEEPKEEDKKKEPEEEEGGEELSAYTKFLKEYLSKNKGATVKDAVSAWTKNSEQKELAEREAEFESAMNTILEHFKNRKEGELSGKTPFKGSAKELVEFVESKEKQVTDLNERIEKLETKLNEPEKITVKTESEPSKLLTEYSDENMLKFLERQQGVIEV